MTYTNEELLETYKTDMMYSKKKKSLGTIDIYLKDIGYFLSFLNNKPIFDVTEDDVYDYLDSIKNLARNTYSQRLSAIKSLYRILRINRTIKKQYNIVDPAIYVEGYDRECSNKTPMSKREQMLLLKYAKNKREKALFTIMLSCGLRASEVIALTLAQYQTRVNGREILLTETKGNKIRYIVLNDECIDAIDEYLPTRKDGCDKLFVSNGSKPMDRSCMSRTIKTVARRSGGFTEDRITQLNNHLCRHTTADVLLNEMHEQLHVVQAVLGHSSPKTTQIYAKTNLSTVREAMLRKSFA